MATEHPKVGRKLASGTVYPTKTLGGLPFERTDQPPTTIPLNKTEFVVLDMFPTYKRKEALEALRTELREQRQSTDTPQTRKPEVKSEPAKSGE